MMRMRGEKEAEMSDWTKSGWTLRYYWKRVCVCIVVLIGILALLLTATLGHAAILESPGDGDTPSGTGVISGWKCDAHGPLTVTTDGGGPIPDPGHTEVEVIEQPYVRSRYPYPDGVSVFWTNPRVPINLQLGCPAPEAGEICWDAVFQEAAAEWNDVGTEFQLTFPPPQLAADPCDLTDGLNTVAWLDTLCGQPWGPRIGARIWWLITTAGEMLDVAILFNSRYRSADWWHEHWFYTLALHELGHVAGLDHPDEAGQVVDAVMNSYSSGDMLFADDIAGLRALYPARRLTAGVLENPQDGAIKSGVGVLSGWVCEAETVEIELNGVRLQTGYGTTRGDTQGICGDSNNGFSLLINWNLLGPGQHTARLFADGYELQEAAFRVVTFGQEFLRDVHGSALVRNFPWPGWQARLMWEESTQNFVIVETLPPRQ